MAWTTPRTWVTGELVTAAMLNTHVRDNLDYLYPMSAAAHIATVEGVSTAAGFHSFPTPGPIIAKDTSSEVWVELSAEITNITGAGAGNVYLSVAVSGATTINPSIQHGYIGPQDYAGIHTFTFKIAGLNTGSNTFEMQASNPSAGNSPTFGLRSMRITRLN